jgi:hypothetical protein
MSLGELPLPELDSQRLAALVFELASQLHAERSHRLALETALERSGVLPRAALEALAGDAAFQQGCRQAVDESVLRLLRVLTERADARQPLRPASASATAGGR